MVLSVINPFTNYSIIDFSNYFKNNRNFSFWGTVYGTSEKNVADAVQASRLPSLKSARGCRRPLFYHWSQNT